MFPFHVDSVVVFRYAKRGVYKAAYHSIMFNVCGLRHIQAGGVSVTDDMPMLLLQPRGTVVDFEYGPQRENWGIMLNTDHWRCSKVPGKLDIRFTDKWTSLPMLTKIDKAHVPQWQKEMALLRELFLNPLPINLTRLELGVANILRFVLERNSDRQQKHTPAHQLKVLLDCPDSRQLPMQQLAIRIGLSPERLRALFRAEFGISPVAYRTQARMAEAMDLLTHTGMSVKEISYELGFKHISHFSQAFAQSFGMPPRAAIAKYRF